MIGIDTNVLIRFLTQDDPARGPQATAFIASLTKNAPGFIGREVMVESVWVLERAYNLPRERIVAALEGLLEAQELIVEVTDQVAIALARYAKGGAGFADHMISLNARAAGCHDTVTFDKKAASGAEMRMLGADDTH